MIQSKSFMLIRPAMLLVAALSAAPVGAVELGRGVQAHGFFSQSLVYTSDNNVGGKSDDGLATDMRELGANLSWRPNADWLLSGQVLARWAGASDDGDPRLDYGFVDRSLLSDGDTSLGLRLGKIKNPYGFYNTTRDVAHTRPGIIMPQSVYMDRVRNFYLATPGIAVYGNHVTKRSDISWSLGVIRPDGDDPELEGLFLTQQDPGRFKGKNSWLGQVLTELDGSRWRIGLTLGEINMQFHPGSGSPFGAGSSRLLPLVLSLERNTEKFSLTAEYSEVKNSGSGYGVAAFDDSNTLLAWYVQGTYRPAEHWRVYLRRGEIYADKSDREGVRQTVVPPYTMFAKNWTLGVRHDINEWALSAEWHRVDGTLWVSPLDTPFKPVNQQKADWDMLLLQAAWYF